MSRTTPPRSSGFSKRCACALVGLGGRCGLGSRGEESFLNFWNPTNTSPPVCGLGSLCPTKAVMKSFWGENNQMFCRTLFLSSHNLCKQTIVRCSMSKSSTIVPPKVSREFPGRPLRVVAAFSSDKETKVCLETLLKHAPPERIHLAEVSMHVRRSMCVCMNGGDEPFEAIWLYFAL